MEKRKRKKKDIDNDGSYFRLYEYNRYAALTAKQVQ